MGSIPLTNTQADALRMDGVVLDCGVCTTFVSFVWMVLKTHETEKYASVADGTNQLIKWSRHFLIHFHGTGLIPNWTELP